MEKTIEQENDQVLVSTAEATPEKQTVTDTIVDWVKKLLEWNYKEYGTKKKPLK
ncbi:hypothetical protein [Desulforhopalus singaporensis]|uniref:Uncharacterized protein n=1 Tax=Desulforhopalus singaporensis TaxID=91360 RepID=A0A1H0J2P9_9BACT|nr:hypothetical protein [Desulforhopalus singaporensis]SDO37986.1 hypothetical protein SAMN05660330_00124 [Desulforhopalus singaporensis]